MVQVWTKQLFRITLLLGLLPLIGYSQSVQEYENLKAKYPGLSTVMLNREEVYYMDVKSGKPDVKGDYITRFLLFDTKTFGNNEQSIPYCPGFYELAELEAATYYPKNGKYTKVEVKNFKDEDRVNGRSHVFYDGIKHRKFFFESIVPGAILETKFRYNYTDPSALGAFFFNAGMPLIHGSLTVNTSDKITIGYKIFGDTTGVRFTETHKGNKVTYKWEVNDQKEVKRYGDAVDNRYSDPHIYIYIQDYKDSKGNKVRMFGTVADLYKHDYEYLREVNKVPVSGEVQKVVDSIVQYSPTRTDKIRNIYYWVQDHIKYVAFEDGLGGQVPREANDIFVKRFGDCKDFASLITTMLKAAGVESYLTWIGTRDIPYTYEQLPLGYVSNHMIASVWDNRRWNFLDGTSKYTAYGSPSPAIQGKQAMISISPDSFVVVEVPVMPAKYTYEYERADMRLDGDKLVGNGSYQLGGYGHTYCSNRIYYLGVDKREEYIKDMLSLGNNKCEIKDITYEHLEDKDSPLVFRYAISLPSYVKFIDNDLFINMHLTKGFAVLKVDTLGGRTISKELPYAYEEGGVFSFKIPDGYVVKKIPADKEYKGKHLQYFYKYEVKDNTVFLKKGSAYDKMTVDKEDFDEWNKQMDEIIKCYKDLVILTKK